MSRWPGKFVIGLTGNIGTGKSVVRKMLEHLGAYGIDADALSHRAIARGAPGYKPIVQTFGTWILTPAGDIHRGRLGKIVFSDPEALEKLEKIVHPLVDNAVDILISRSKHQVIVIEAIKILESSLRGACDSIWVTTANPETQLARLIERRGMAESEARQRITAQPPQEKKIAAADVVIQNDGDYENAWRQVHAGWHNFVPSEMAESLAAGADVLAKAERDFSVLRGRPGDASEIAAFINLHLKPATSLRPEDILAAFGEKAFLLLRCENRLVGLIGWQVENLIARTLDLVIDPAVPQARALQLMLHEVERASKELQCEVSLVYALPELSNMEAIWRAVGYEQRIPAELDVQAWKEAAEESRPTETAALFFRKLRQDRILRPI